MPNVVEHIMAKNNVLRLDPFEITGIESVAKCMHICWENTLTIGSLDVGNKWKDSKPRRQILGFDKKITIKKWF